MNYIVLVKQVPDIRNIPDEAWDWEKGTLKRAFLTNVLNELDKQALAFAIRMREKQPGQIVALTMGPPFAEEVLRYSMSVGADAGILVTDRKMGGADTAATAYPLGQAVRKIEKEIFHGDRNYVILAGMQSVDGDTAQVPAQVAEELGIAHIAYAEACDFSDGELKVTRITRRGDQIVSPTGYPCVITATSWTEPLNAAFSRTRWTSSQKITAWGAPDISAVESRIGLPGSRTTPFRIFSPKDINRKKTVIEDDLGKLVKLIKDAYTQRLAEADKPREHAAYQFPEGKAGSYHGEVWVYIEQEGGEINVASLEVLGQATELARILKEKVGAVLAGNGIGGLEKEVVAFGADKVYVADDPLLAEFLPVPYTRAVTELVEKYHPQMILFSATPMGRELAPRIAYRANSGLTADCTSLEIFDFKRGATELTAILKQTRPALGGNIMASIITQNSTIQMATARPGVLRALKPDYGRKGEIIEHTASLSGVDPGVRIISTESRPLSSELKDAVAIVSGGLGVKTREGYDKYIRPLAASLGKCLCCEVMVGASRLAVEAGFIDRSHQVGQTGQTVKPKIYVAVGISGAIQHLTGMQNSDVIVAINKNPAAPIFKVADFGVVGDIEEVVPKLCEALSNE
ncbi:MAG: FAD-binding protein [Dehalococcoidales bacterium]|nr:FAD-binding protein [Dehalococcoidales bacterium]